MKITCKEYNAKWENENHGFVVRNFFDRWVVCDGYAPHSDTLTDENSIFVGYIVKSFKTYEEANNLRNLLNAE